jgi:hypothetical protein
MKNTTDTAWDRLVANARLAPPPDLGDLAAPYGFAQRVATLAMQQKPSIGALFELFSWRALAMAALIAVATVAVNLKSVLKPVDDSPVTLSDPVEEVLSVT